MFININNNPRNPVNNNAFIQYVRKTSFTTQLHNDLSVSEWFCENNSLSSLKAGPGYIKSL